MNLFIEKTIKHINYSQEPKDDSKDNQ